jgi:hypothetical protein
MPSRAKQKVVLVTSCPTAEISTSSRRAPTLARDYLQGYMRYAELVHDGDFEAAPTSSAHWQPCRSRRAAGFRA